MFLFTFHFNKHILLSSGAIFSSFYFILLLMYENCFYLNFDVPSSLIEGIISYLSFFLLCYSPFKCRDFAEVYMYVDAIVDADAVHQHLNDLSPMKKQQLIDMVTARNEKEYKTTC